jgi:hypothetical protein
VFLNSRARVAALTLLIGRREELAASDSAGVGCALAVAGVSTEPVLLPLSKMLSSLEEGDERLV